MKKWICLCLIMLLCAAACAMLAEGEALPANDEPPVEKNLTHGMFEAAGPIEEKTVALPDGTALPEKGLDILHRSSTGKLQTLILRGREEDNLAWLEKLHPLFMDSVPLTLEEIFIYELGGVDDAVRKNVL